MRWVREYFTGGNTLVRVGIVILFFGVAFLLRYVAEHTHVPIEFRLTGVAAAADRAARPRDGACAASAQDTRSRCRAVPLASCISQCSRRLKIYGLMSPALAFPLLVLIAAFSAVLAVMQNSLASRCWASTGGFLAPILASTGQGNHVVLFSYYAVLNAGILVVAWFKAWRPLNCRGFRVHFRDRHGLGRAAL